MYISVIIKLLLEEVIYGFEMVNKEVADVFSTYETSMENRIRYISGMEHFIQYLYHQNIELENVGN